MKDYKDLEDALRKHGDNAVADAIKDLRERALKPSALVDMIKIKDEKIELLEERISNLEDEITAILNEDHY